ncbi:MAG: peptide deformylase [Candidatus Moranbacteria bacterium]|jgi:peptide deformylase|nr:peptide deformylase [Candidatus Moranbacteria bacterium]MDD5652067.1 peptide deformylase [Candidatus Moranbacteria bacterium]MDX9855768.1 peptide deformylase [Candidatus Moranbacteria bacterium]
MKIIAYPDPILEKKSEKIKNPLDPEIQKLIIDMIQTMRENKGIGLAAPQIGKSIRLCVIEIDKKSYVFINPKITSESKECDISEEGCLSFPGKFLPIKRFSGVTVRYLNEKGEKCKIKAEALLARALQHEIDHLNGKLFINK